jgi:branched-chain amino acid transport system substrate-binding protein
VGRLFEKRELGMVKHIGRRGVLVAAAAGGVVAPFVGRSAFAAKQVKIGAVLPITGPNAAVGIGMMNAMDLAVRQINSSGKFGALQFELMKLDDQSLPSEGVAAVTRAASDPAVMACSAHWNSPVALATRDIFHRRELANLNPCAINWKITAEQKGDEIFRIAPSDLWQLEMAAKMPFVTLGKKTYYLIDDNTNDGKSLVGAFEENATKAGGNKLGGDSIAVGEKDFTAVLTKAKAMKPDVIFFGGVTTEAALLRQQMVRLEIPALYYTGSGTMTPTYVETAGAAADGTYAFFYGLPYTATPGGGSFIEAYKKAGYDKPYETYGLIAYAAIEAVAQAVAKAAAGGEPSRKAVIEALKTETFATALGPLSFPRPGDAAQKVLAFYVVKDGKWTLTHYSKPDGGIVVAEKQSVWDLPWK